MPTCSGSPPALRRWSLKKDHAEVANPRIDRHRETYIGVKQVRPDSGYSSEIRGTKGELLANRRLGTARLRNAVESARKAYRGFIVTAHTVRRCFITIAENLSQRSEDIAGRLASRWGRTCCRRSAGLFVERLFSYSGWADKFDGAVHNPPSAMFRLAMKLSRLARVECVCPSKYPLLVFLRWCCHLIAWKHGCGGAFGIISADHGDL